jgi:flagellar biosynthetic protein FliO
MMPPELMTAALKMIGVLALIIGALLAVNRYSKRFLKSGLGGRGGKHLQILESTPMGLKKSITLLKVPGAVLVLGVTADRITLLDRMDGRDYADLADVQEQPRFSSFQDQLRKVTDAWQRRPMQADPVAPVDSKPC